uniref:Uncharacterized protein n=1 Tax=Rhizophora mucronata TaxID=61149 RepID=A0A2P2IH27_RHIMU
MCTNSFVVFTSLQNYIFCTASIFDLLEEFQLKIFTPLFIFALCFLW